MLRTKISLLYQIQRESIMLKLAQSPSAWNTSKTYLKTSTEASLLSGSLCLTTSRMMSLMASSVKMMKRCPWFELMFKYSLMKRNHSNLSLLHRLLELRVPLLSSRTSPLATFQLPTQTSSTKGLQSWTSIRRVRLSYLLVCNIHQEQHDERLWLSRHQARSSFNNSNQKNKNKRSPTAELPPDATRRKPRSTTCLVTSSALGQTLQVV